MNHQFLSVLFCALICSTLGHEYLQAKELSHQNKHHRRSHQSVLHYRDNNDSCTFVCPVPQPSPQGENLDIRILINKKDSIVAVLNQTSLVAITVDVNANLAVLLNGKNGAGIFIDLVAGTGIHFPAGACDGLWLASKSSFVEFFLALGSLKNVKNLPNGQAFEINSAPNKVVVDIVVIISPLALQIAERIKLNQKVAIPIIIAISKVISGTLGGSLSILVERSEATEYLIVGGLLDFALLLRGLNSLSDKISGGLGALITADIDFKLSLILAATSGLQAVVALLSQVGKTDLSKSIAAIIKSPEAFLEVVVSLEAGNYSGLPGVEAVLYNLLLLISNKISLTVFIDILIQVSGSGGNVSKEGYLAVIGSLVSLIQSQINNYQSSEAWQNLLSFFTDLQSGKLSVGGIHVSGVLAVIFENGGKVSLSLVVNILLKVSPIVGIGAALSTLFIRLVFFVVSGQGLTYIIRLIPGILSNIDLSSSVSIIVQVLRGLNVLKIVGDILTLNIIGLIKDIPILGSIFNALVSALSSAGKGSGDLESALKGSNVLQVLFGWINFGLGRGGNQPKGEISGLVFIGAGATISIDVNISRTVSIGSSSTLSEESSTSQSISTSKSSSSSSKASGLGGKATGTWAYAYKNHEGKKHLDNNKRSHDDKASNLRHHWH